jgi:hypothetical protein
MQAIKCSYKNFELNIIIEQREEKVKAAFLELVQAVVLLT